MYKESPHYFAEKLKELMDECDIKSIQPLAWEMFIGWNDNNEFRMEFCNIKYRKREEY